MVSELNLDIWFKRFKIFSWPGRSRRCQDLGPDLTQEIPDRYAGFRAVTNRSEPGTCRFFPNFQNSSQKCFFIWENWKEQKRTCSRMSKLSSKFFDEIAFFFMIHHQISLKIKKEHLTFTILSESTYQGLSFEPLVTFFGCICQEIRFVFAFGSIPFSADAR